MSVVVDDETSSCAAPCAGQKDVMTKWPLQNNAHERRVRVARDAEVCATIYYGNFRRPRAVELPVDGLDASLLPWSIRAVSHMWQQSGLSVSSKTRREDYWSTSSVHGT